MASNSKSKEKATIVITTIRKPTVLHDIFNNLTQYGHLSKVDVVVIPDLKTPQSCFDLCKEMNELGLSVKCPSVDEQDVFLKQEAPELVPYILYNSDCRRNIGYLMALQNKSKTIISLDDDNFPLADEDFYYWHMSNKVKYVAVSSSWYNYMDCLVLSTVRLFPRGFPYYARSARELSRDNFKSSICQRPIVANQGLWIGDPDIDAVSRLQYPNERVDFVKNVDKIALSPTLLTYTPINSQNTSVQRKAMVAYFYLPVGGRVYGLPFERCGDILQGFFLQKVAFAFNETISLGRPIVRHTRLGHTPLKDLRCEIGSIMLLEKFCHILERVKVEGSSYSESYLNLTDQMFSKLMQNDCDKDTRRVLCFLKKACKAWIKVTGRLV